MDAPQPKADEDAREAVIGEKMIVKRETMVERHARIRNDPEREARWAAWREENAGVIASWNDYVEEHGLPLAQNVEVEMDSHLARGEGDLHPPLQGEVAGAA